MIDKVKSLVASLRLVAIIRLDDLSDAVEISRALLQAGVFIQEFTLSNPAAIDAVREVRDNVPQFSTDAAALGIGSVRSTTQVAQAIDAGAQFIVTPTTQLDVIARCCTAQIPVFSGAFTPTEIAAAWDAGATCVKVFPARGLGPSFIKDVLAPMPYLRLMPTGGVDLSNIQAYLDAGAEAVGVGGNIIDTKAIVARDWQKVTAGAQRFAECARRKEP